MGGTILGKQELERAYQIWERASYLIIEGKDDFQLSDGILNLKRSLKCARLKLIEEYYKFKRLEGMPKGYLERFRTLGYCTTIYYETIILNKK